jgi:hypothetical protein
MGEWAASLMTQPSASDDIHTARPEAGETWVVIRGTQYPTSRAVTTQPTTPIYKAQSGASAAPIQHQRVSRHVSGLGAHPHSSLAYLLRCCHAA